MNSAPSAFRLMPALVLVFAMAGWIAAQDLTPPPAVVELRLPTGATAAADGKPLDKSTLTVADLKADEIRRIKLAVTFADGTADERLVDVAAGQRLLLPIPHPGPERAATVAVQALTPINAAAISRDGRFIAAGLEDRAIVIWDTLVGRPIRTFTGHQKVVLAVAFSPDGKQLLSGSADTAAILWDFETGARVHTYKGHTGSVASAVFSPDGTRIFTGSPDGTAILWDTKTAERIHTFRTKEVLGVAYSPDGSTLATASADTTATLWDASSGKQTAVLRGHREGVSSIAFSPDSRRVATGSFENFGIVWDAASGKRITMTGRHGNDVYSVAFTRDGRRILTGEREEVVMLSDAATGTHLRTFAGHNADIGSILPRSDGRTLLTASRDGTARLWDLATGRELLTLTTDSTRKTWAVAAPDGLFDASESGRRAIGYRFTKVGAELDQFFTERYRPGLLAQVWRGERPIADKPMGRTKPPLVRIVSPKDRVAAAERTTVVFDVTDQGGGVSRVLVENNGIRVAAVPATSGRLSITVPLVPGANKLRVKAANGDGSWDSAGVELELTRPRAPGQRGRMYVVAIGTGDDAAKDARKLAELLQSRGGSLHDRVDLVPLFGRDATPTNIDDTVKDVAELTRPQDTLVVILCGRGDVDSLAAAMGTANALQRVLIVDGTDDVKKERSEFGHRGSVERWSRAHGVHAIVANSGELAATLVATAGADGPLNVMDWFHAAATKSHAHVSTQAKGFPILSTPR